MFGLKTKLKKKFQAFLLSKNGRISFPFFPLSMLEIQKVILGIQTSLREDSATVSLDNPSPRLANPIATTVWKRLVSFHSNHLGNWTLEKPYNSTTQLEKEVIKSILHLYQEKAGNFSGYVGSGSTEGNLLAAWMGRSFLQKKTKIDNIVLLKTDLTHYSVEKCARIVGIKSKTVGLSQKLWAMDPVAFEKTVLTLYQKGMRGFLIPLTLGYTSSGTDDPVEEICRKITALKRHKKDIHFFVWIDAALSGLVLPFAQKPFRPFSSPEIQLITIDFHKFAGVPYPASVILYRKKLSSLIVQKIPYLDQNDATLIGSRPGTAAVAIWATLQYQGKNGFTALVKKSMEQKKRFLHSIQQEVPDIAIISNPYSIQAMLVVRRTLIPKTICQKYGLVLREYSLLFSAKREKIRYYKLFFLPKF